MGSMSLPGSSGERRKVIGKVIFKTWLLLVSLPERWKLQQSPITMMMRISVGVGGKSDGDLVEIVTVSALAHN